MFLGLKPDIAVVTNVEWDHPDCYPTPASFRRAFMQFTDGVERDGRSLPVSTTRARCRCTPMRRRAARAGSLYGTGEGADLRATYVRSMPGRRHRSRIALVECAGRRAAAGQWPARTTCATRWPRWRWRCQRTWTPSGAGGAAGLSRLQPPLRVEGRGAGRHRDRRLRPPPHRDPGDAGGGAPALSDCSASGLCSSRTPSAARSVCSTAWARASSRRMR
jgi:hypothetical protein